MAQSPASMQLQTLEFVFAQSQGMDPQSRVWGLECPVRILG